MDGVQKFAHAKRLAEHLLHGRKYGVRHPINQQDHRNISTPAFFLEPGHDAISAAPEQLPIQDEDSRTSATQSGQTVQTIAGTLCLVPPLSEETTVDVAQLGVAFGDEQVRFHDDAPLVERTAATTLTVLRRIVIMVVQVTKCRHQDRAVRSCREIPDGH
jgi:hypothetical protein